MVVNEHLTWRRKWARQLPTAVVPATSTSPDHAVQITDRDDLMPRLQALPPRQRAAVVLRYYGGLSDLEVADALGCSPGTARGYLSRALATMRIQLTADSNLARKDA
jgi:RNA polymerase sigma factor (sigma-70 family)